MPALEVAVRHARQRARLATRLRSEARQAWRQVDPARISSTWAAQLPRLLVALTAGQRAAAATADEYLDAQGVPGDVRVNPDAFAGVASDGRDLATLFALPAIVALTGLAQGHPLARAMAAGGGLAELAAHTQVADAGRVADLTGMVGRGSPGYVRMAVGATCSRCIILAGRWYRWNAGFSRHPKCDCVGIPATESAHELRTDPKKVFESMSTVQQDKVFTQAGAQAIRDGADMNQIVNARRGAAGLSPAGGRLTADEIQLLRGGREIGHLETRNVFGRDLFVTSEGTTTRGVAGQRLGSKVDGVKNGGRYRSAKAPRLMPESIYQIAGSDRAEAIRLLKRFGYII